MKKIRKTLLLLIISLFGLINVQAAEADRADINNKTLVNVDGHNVYVSVEISTNMEDLMNRDQVTVKGVSARYDSSTQTFYVSAKRSEINKIFTEKYNNVYELMQINIDYHDIKANTEYYYFKQYMAESAAGTEFSFHNANADYLYRNYNILELVSSSLPLAGTVNGVEQYSYGGDMVVFEGTPSATFVEGGKYNRTDFESNSGGIKLFDFAKTKVRANIIEDVQIDLGENDKVVSADSSDVEQIEKEINNFYGEYFENNKLKYSWTMYDENGKPVIVDVNTAITFDDSANRDNIMTLFNKSNDLQDKVMIVSFEHHGDLNGKAKISLYVGDKFAPGTKLNIYYYVPEETILDDVNPPYSLGDVSKDGRISILDVTYLRQYLAGKRELDEEALKAADYNQDQTITVTDADLIQQSLADADEEVGVYGIGDVSKDGRISILDVTYIRQYLAGIRELDEEAKIIADFNLDKQITEVDADLIQNYIATIEQQVIVVDAEGYIVFELEHCSDYVLAESSVQLLTDQTQAPKAVAKKVTGKADKNNWLLYGGIAGGVIIIATGGIIIYKRKKKQSL